MMAFGMNPHSPQKYYATLAILVITLFFTLCCAILGFAIKQIRTTTGRSTVVKES